MRLFCWYQTQTQTGLNNKVNIVSSYNRKKKKKPRTCEASKLVGLAAQHFFFLSTIQFLNLSSAILHDVFILRVEVLYPDPVMSIKEKRLHLSLLFVFFALSCLLLPFFGWVRTFFSLAHLQNPAHIMVLNWVPFSLAPTPGQGNKTMFRPIRIYSWTQGVGMGFLRPMACGRGRGRNG